MKSSKLRMKHIIAVQFLIIAFLLPSPAISQPPSDDTKTHERTLGPRVVLTLIITLVIFFIAFIWVFIRSCYIDESSPSVIPLTAANRRARGGLDSAVIDSFPTFDYSAIKALKIGKGALECAVCLNEFEGDETLRLIPRCDHVFHAECVDVWLASHATCPVCRANLVPDSGEPLDAPDRNDDVAIEVASQEEQANISRPPPWLIRSRTRGNGSGRRRWYGSMFARSNSTGHVADVTLENSQNTERFTLRVTEEVRRQIMSGKLSRTSTSIALQMAEGSSERGPDRVR